MPKLLCVKCQVELRPETNHFIVLEKEANRIIEADKWKCPGCGIEIVAGFASTGLEFWQKGFADELARTIRLPHGEWCCNNTRVLTDNAAKGGGKYGR